MSNETPQENISNAGKGGDGSESGEGSTKSEFIKLKVSDQDNNQIYFRVKKAVELGKLMKMYSKRINVPVENLKFLFDGVRVKDSDTPQSREMEDGDSIDVFLEQIGGFTF